MNEPCCKCTSERIPDDTTSPATSSRGRVHLQNECRSTARVRRSYGTPGKSKVGSERASRINQCGEDIDAPSRCLDVVTHSLFCKRPEKKACRLDEGSSVTVTVKVRRKVYWTVHEVQYLRSGSIEDVRPQDGNRRSRCGLLRTNHNAFFHALYMC